MTVGLMCALPEELAQLRAATEVSAVSEVAGVAYVEGSLDGHRVVLAAAGMGKVNAAVVATLLASRWRCTAVVNSGVAGGLDPDLAIGDVVVAERIVQHDTGVLVDDALQHYQAGHVPFINPTDGVGHTMDPTVADAVRGALAGATPTALSSAAGGRGRPPRIVLGTVLTGDQYVHCETTRRRLHGTFAGHAVEMEGGAVAQVCDAFGVGWVVVRALSDLAGGDSSLDFGLFAAEVATTSAALVRRILPAL